MQHVRKLMLTWDVAVPQTQLSERARGFSGCSVQMDILYEITGYIFSLALQTIAKLAWAREVSLPRIRWFTWLSTLQNIFAFGSGAYQRGFFNWPTVIFVERSPTCSSLSPCCSETQQRFVLSQSPLYSFLSLPIFGALLTLNTTI